MAKKDVRIDRFIAEAPAFAQPILMKLRSWMHKHCPDVQETIKWGMPHFEYKGILAGMGNFKAHAVFGFWKGELIYGKTASEQEAMGQFGRMTSVKDLPSEALFKKWVKQAMKLNDEGIVTPSRSKPKAAKKSVRVPPYFIAAVKKDKKAWATFESFSPSHKREYVEWITEAKTEETRARRLAEAVRWMSEGKPRMWKYIKK
jgi:hypothetical protein